MSLVAYDASSDEESDAENEENEIRNESTAENKLNGHISDDDEYDDTPGETIALNARKDNKKHLNLPAPRTQNPIYNEPVENELVPLFDKLPAPKKVANADIVEEDDEFLHKKEVPPDIEKPVAKKGPVRITIPALSEFKDLENRKPSTSINSQPGPSSKVSSLLSLLPKPKNQIVLGRAQEKPSTSKVTATTTSLVPDSVKNQTARKIAPSPSSSKKPPTKRSAPVNIDDSDDEVGDFFSLNVDEKLPEVSDKEINAMLAKHNAEKAEAKKRINQMIDGEPEAEAENDGLESYDNSQSGRSQEIAFDDRAMQALVGSRAKRQKFEQINVVDLSANEVLPDKDEWLRSALASSTSYQARGVLVDEEPAPGTRKKHQITYLAHQAKSNEMELQAMWSANRHTKRQTQAKYGF